jgi:hypothetical protein
LLDIGVAQRIFERREGVAVDADAAREEDAFGKWKHRPPAFWLMPHAPQRAGCNAALSFVAALRDKPVTSQVQGRTKKNSMNILSGDDNKQASRTGCRREHLMKDFSNPLCNLSAVTLLLGISVGAIGAQAGVTGGRTRALEPHRQFEAAGLPGVRIAGKSQVNCTTSIERTVGAQRVWTPHGVITVGGHVQKVPDCR